MHRVHRLTHVKHVAFDALHPRENRRFRAILVECSRRFADGLLDSERKAISMESTRRVAAPPTFVAVL